MASSDRRRLGPAPISKLHGLHGVEHAIQTVLDQIDGPEPSASCVGLAGSGRPTERRIVTGVLRDLGLGPTLSVVHDAEIALVAGVTRGAGVAVVAGTGSMAYGKDFDGRSARSGGWGHLLGDEGSAFWLGREAIRLCLESDDGRGPETALSELLAHGLQLDIPDGLISWVYNDKLAPSKIAALLPLVQKAAEQGDSVAECLIEEAADHLARAAHAVASQLELGPQFQLVLAGGAFLGCPLLEEAFRRRLLLPEAQVSRLQMEPAFGAVKLALELLP